MKRIIPVLALFIFAACASTKKAETAPEATTTETTATTPPTTSQDKPATAGKTEKNTTMSSDGGLPSITGSEKSSVTCTNKKDTRKISVLTVAEGGCGVVYNKLGEEKTVAMAKSDMNYCDTVSSKIKTNLEGAGFNCGGAAGTSSDQPAQ
jgi:hypothetical protein